MVAQVAVAGAVQPLVSGSLGSKGFSAVLNAPPIEVPGSTGAKNGGLKTSANLSGAKTTGPSSLAKAISPAVQQVQAAQARLDRVLQLAQSGRTFSPAELLALQAHTYRAGHEIEVAGKLVEKASSALKQTLQTQL